MSIIDMMNLCIRLIQCCVLSNLAVIQWNLLCKVLESGSITYSVTVFVQIQECQDQSQLSAIDFLDGYNVFYFENQNCYMGRKGQFNHLFNLNTTGFNLNIASNYIFR